MVESIKKGRGVCLKAVGDDSKILGMIHAMQENTINGREGAEKWVITSLAVSPNETGKGIGGRLLKLIESEANNQGVKKMFTHTNLEDNRVIHFYEKNGYKLAGEIKDYYYDGSAVFLIKYLG